MLACLKRAPTHSNTRHSNITLVYAVLFASDDETRRRWVLTRGGSSSNFCCVAARGILQAYLGVNLMGLTILRDRASINAAIATMNPVASEAAQLLAYRIFEQPDMLENQDAMFDEWVQVLAVTAARHGMDPAGEDPKFRHFVEQHGNAVLNVAYSIVVFAAEESERQKRWGWLGKAAAVGAGVLIGSFFG